MCARLQATIPNEVPMSSSPRLLAFVVLPLLAAPLGAEPARDRFGDPLPEGAVARLGSLRLRHRHSVQVGDFSADGKLVAAFDGGNSIIFWDATSGREARRVPAGRLFQPRCFRFSPDGKALILADRWGEYRIIDAVTGAEPLKLDSDKQDRRYHDVHAVSVSRDGRTAVTLYGAPLVVWDLAGGKRLREFSLPNNLNRFSNDSIALTPDGKHLVVPHMDGSLHLLDVTSGREVFAFEMPSDRPRKDPPMVTMSPDGRCLAYGGSSNPSNDPCHSITLCDMTTGKRLRELSSKDRIGEWVFTPDSRSLAVTHAETIRLFDVSSGEERKALPKPSRSWGFVFSPDGQKLAASWGTCILVWDVAAGRLLHSPVGHPWFLRILQFSPDGKRLVSHTSIRGEIIVWDVATSRPLASHLSGELQGWIAFTADGEAIRFRAWSPNPPLPGIRRWKWATNRVEQEPAASSPPAGGRRVPDEAAGERASGPSAIKSPNTPSRGTFAPDGRSVALNEGGLCIREVSSGKDRLRIARPGSTEELTFSPNERYLACNSHDGNDGSTRVFSTATGKLLARLQGKQGIATALAFSPDSRSLATGGFDGSILLWKLPKDDELPATLSQEEAAAFWQALAGDDAARANRALTGLAAAPAQALPLIKERFPTEWKKPRAEQVARWIVELDDDSFKVRERAERALADAGADIVAELRKALANNPTVEAKKRLDGLINRLNGGGGPERLRSLRAIEVLERIGTAQAKELLRELSRKSLPADLDDEIRASLRRLGERP
jgi:WD40 repeat protein